MKLVVKSFFVVHFWKALIQPPGANDEELQPLSDHVFFLQGLPSMTGSTHAVTLILTLFWFSVKKVFMNGIAVCLPRA